MKVIKDNNTNLPVEEICERCKSVVLIESIDELEEYGGETFLWECPCCGEKNITFSIRKSF